MRVEHNQLNSYFKLVEQDKEESEEKAALQRENNSLQLQGDELEDRLNRAEEELRSFKQYELKQGDIIRIKKVADKKEKQ